MLLTVKETKQLMKISTASIYRMFENGQLKKIKLGHSTRVEIPKDILEKYEDQLKALNL